MDSNVGTDPLIFYVNGRKVIDRHVEPETTLIHYLRNKLYLTGTKLGCGEGGCGACTVMISRYNHAQDHIVHHSVVSCLLPVCYVHGMHVTTVEGIGSIKNGVHPVQMTIANAHGSQCGFCTPGIVMSMYTLIRNNPQPTMEEIQDAFEGNLCRCTGYRPILEGFKKFSKEWTTAPHGGPQGCGMGENCCMVTNGHSDETHNDNVNGDDDNGVDTTQDVIFPPELMKLSKMHNKTFRMTGERVTWIRPASLNELLLLKSEYPHAKIVNGNTEVGVEMKFKNMYYPVLISPTHIEELTRVTVDNDKFNIGAAVTLSDLDGYLKNHIKTMPEHKMHVVKSVVEMLKLFAGFQIRNVATLGGNIATSSPISDLIPILMACGATITLESSSGKARDVTLDEEFFKGYRKTIIQPEELITVIHMPHTKQNEYFKEFKQSRRRDDDIAIVNAGMRVRLDSNYCVDDISLAFGGMSATPVMALSTMEYLKKRTWDTMILSDVYDYLKQDLVVLPDAPGGQAEYRMTLALSFFFKFYMLVSSQIPDLKVDVREESMLAPLHRGEFKALQSFQEIGPGQPKYDAVGRPLMHYSALEQSTGSAVYCDDVPPIAGELFMGLVLSSKAHAKIKSIDTSRALELDGVHMYVGADDVPGENAIGMFYDETVFASDKVNFIGHLIGAVLAEDRLLAQRAAKLVKVEYEELKPIITIEEAIAADSYHGEVDTLEKGNVQEAFNAADHILEGELRIGGQEHFYLEVQCCIAIPKGEKGEMEIISSTQNPTLTQTFAAKALNVNYNRVVCKVKRIGGGFGGKCTCSGICSTSAVVCAHKCGRSVRCVLDREEDMLMTGGRHPMVCRYKVGFTKSGRITVVDANIYANSGHSIDFSKKVVHKSMISFDNCYLIPNIKLSGRACKTNMPSNTAFRGFGVPQGSFFIESLMSDISQYTGIHEMKVRRMNMYSTTDVTHYDEPVLSDFNNLLRCWDDCVEKSQLTTREAKVHEFNRNNRWKKRGINMIPMKFRSTFSTPIMKQGGALVQVYTDGSVLVTHGGIEMGQGLHIKMIQVASRVLGIGIDLIHINETSTDKVPNTSPTAATVAADINGAAIKMACEKILHTLKPIVDSNPGGKWIDWIKNAYSSRLSLSATGFYNYTVDGEPKVLAGGFPYLYLTFGVCCTEVEIDCLTGDHQQLRTDIVMDVGRSLNPSIDIGQIEGAYIQGAGLFTIEEQRVSPAGVNYTRGPGAYKLPGFSDIPVEFNVHLLKDTENEGNIFSSRGAGEPSLILAASVFFAIKKAILAARDEVGESGLFRIDSPATSEVIRMACADHITKQFPVPEPGTYKPWEVKL